MAAFLYIGSNGYGEEALVKPAPRPLEVSEQGDEDEAQPSQGQAMTQGDDIAQGTGAGAATGMATGTPEQKKPVMVSPPPFMRPVAAHIATTGATGINTYSFDQKTGEAQWLERPDETTRIGAFCYDPVRRVLYAADRMSANFGLPTPVGWRPSGGGSICAWRVSEEGGLDYLGYQHSFGHLPSSLSLAAGGRFLLCANYGDEGAPATTLVRGGRGWEVRRVFSTTATVSIQLAEDGSLGAGVGMYEHNSISQDENEYKQYYPHPGHTSASPDGSFRLTADNSCDTFYTFRVNAETGALERIGDPVLQEAGTGPRFVAWHPSKQVFYCNNTKTFTVDTYTWDASGKLEHVASLNALDVDKTDRTVSFTQGEMALSRDGLWLYSLGSIVRLGELEDERHGYLGVFKVAEDGSLALVQSLELALREPVGLALSPGSRWLAVTSTLDDAVALLHVADDGTVEASGSLNVPGAAKAVFVGNAADEPGAFATPAAPEQAGAEGSGGQAGEATGQAGEASQAAQEAGV